MKPLSIKFSFPTKDNDNFLYQKFHFSVDAGRDMLKVNHCRT